MSLIEAMMEDCIIMDKSRVPDGEGGFITRWTEGAEILVAITLDSSISARVAEKEGFSNVYTLTTTQENALEFHDVIKRKRDGKTFRVTNDGSDMKTPSISSLNLCQVSAEAWGLTTS